MAVSPSFSALCACFVLTNPVCLFHLQTLCGNPDITKGPAHNGRGRQVPERIYRGISFHQGCCIREHAKETAKEKPPKKLKNRLNS